MLVWVEDIVAMLVHQEPMEHLMAFIILLLDMVSIRVSISSTHSN